MNDQPSTLDRIERLHNRASDTAFVWFPFNRLRPLPHQSITIARCSIMAICFGIYYGAMLSLRQSIFGAEIFSRVILTNSLGAFAVFFLWFNLVTATLWNRRARRLANGPTTEKNTTYTRLLRLLMVSILSIALPACSLLGIRTTPTPDYAVISKEGKIEIRQYPALLIAKTFSTGNHKESGNKAFRILFDYISGKNQSAQKISMTAPVIENASRSNEKISMTAPVVVSQTTEQGTPWAFVMPASYTQQTLPIPTDSRILIEEIPAKRVAALRFSGRWSEKRFEKNKQELAGYLKTKNLRPHGDFALAFYDPPWTLPFLRRNEILIDLKMK